MLILHEINHHNTIKAMAWILSSEFLIYGVAVNVVFVRGLKGFAFWLTREAAFLVQNQKTNQFFYLFCTKKYLFWKIKTTNSWLIATYTSWAVQGFVRIKWVYGQILFLSSVRELLWGTVSVGWSVGRSVGLSKKYFVRD